MHDCEHHNHKQESTMLVRIFLAIVVFLLGLLLDLPEKSRFIIFLTAYIIAGTDVLTSAVLNLVKGKVFDENFLMGIATIGAFAIREYPEAVMVMVLYQIGEYFQHKAVHNSRKSISELMDIRPDTANLEKCGEIIQTTPDKINIDDIIVVKTGEKIPLDGIVVKGSASVDTSALTGESLPKYLKIGDSAVSGCINTNGAIKIRVTKKFTDSTVSKILELVEDSGARKATTEKFITRFAKYYTPIVVLLAILIAILPPLFTGADFNIWIERALILLVISCPCAIVISVPLSFFAGIGGASKCGILIKGSNYLEALSKPETVVFDKTGTITKGSFKIKKIVPQEGYTQEELLEYTTLAESYSNHPIATSVKNAYAKYINPQDVSNIKEFAGIGIQATVKGYKILTGNDLLMKKFGINFCNSNESGTILYTAKDNEFLGYIVISDEIKQESKEAIKELQNQKINTVILTGDNTQIAEMTAKELGITKFYSQLLPSDKVKKLEEIINSKNKKKSVIYAGDGINDAPVIIRADVGIAMGAMGSDSAIEASDIVIMDDDLRKIPLGIKIAKNTMNIVKQNIIFAILIKVAFLTLGGLGLITMWGAVFADVGVTLIAVLNALRALKAKCHNPL